MKNTGNVLHLNSEQMLKQFSSERYPQDLGSGSRARNKASSQFRTAKEMDKDQGKLR